MQFCRLEWGEPYSGRGTDTFILSNGGRRLTQLSSMEFQDQSKNCTYRWAHAGDALRTPIFSSSFDSSYFSCMPKLSDSDFTQAAIVKVTVGATLSIEGV